ncbi:hypothetical protein MKW98_008322 [Papaver atlanticum]|uniref:Uncharacterized protein n=1 Tax=Papaver atlanticum TaxID=357466 RepID=A0AAD4XXZ2_9MAGN|nr:hypothetical protein MKW98_008322 [Papaver atlanticum]
MISIEVSSEGCRFIKSIMASFGLLVKEDAVGKIFGRWVHDNIEVNDKELLFIPFIIYTRETQYFLSGIVGVLRAIEAINVLRRFIKSIMASFGLLVKEDAYDGVVGVLRAIEAINVLRRSGFKPKKVTRVDNVQVRGALTFWDKLFGKVRIKILGAIKYISVNHTFGY